MTSNKQQLLNTIISVYLCLMTVYTLLREVVVLERIIGNPILSYAVFGIGILLIGAKWLYDRSFFCVKNIWLLIAFVAVCVISALINFRFDLVSNVKAIGWMCIFFFLMYPNGYRSSLERSREISAVFITSVITVSILVAVSLPMYFCNVDYTFYKTTGAFVNHGFSRGYMRLWGVFQEANSAAVYVSAALFMAFYLFKKNKSKLVRAFLVVDCFMMIVFIVLTNSRTIQLGLMLISAWAALYMALTRLSINKIKRFFVSAVSCVLAVVLCYSAFAAVRYALPYVKYGLSQITSRRTTKAIHLVYDRAYQLGKVNVIDGYLSSDGTHDDSNELEMPDEPQILDRTDLEGKDDYSNGRFQRWSDGFKVFLKSPIYGVSPRGIASFAKEYCPDTYIAKYNYNIHNAYIEILAAAGVLGAAFMLLFLFKFALFVLKNVFSKKVTPGFLVCSSIALLLAFAAFLASDLFFNLTFGGIIFWLVIGNLSRDEVTIQQKENTGCNPKKVLVYGLKDPAGGVEKIIFDYVRNLTSSHNITFDFLLFGQNFSLEKDIESIGCRCIYLPSRRSNNKGYTQALKAVFDENNYCAVWGNYCGLTNIDLLIEAKRRSIPVRVAHSHVNRLYWGSPAMKYIVKILHFYNKMRIADYATHYWACSEMAGKFMFPKALHDRISVINNAVDVSVFCYDNTVGNRMREELGIDLNSVVIGHVARICEAKNQVFLLNVFAEIKKIEPNARLLFVGDGELRQQIEDEVQKLGIGESVILTGSRSDVADLIRAMDVFVLPSRSEGLGLSVIEAQACGIPCVVSTEVPKAVNISGAVKFLHLSNSIEKWAREILSHVGTVIDNPTDTVMQSGYEISTAAEKIYLEFAGETL